MRRAALVACALCSSLVAGAGGTDVSMTPVRDATPPLPKLRLPYLDDIELYPPGPLAAAGGRWTDEPTSGALVSDLFNSSPSPGADGGPSTQSIAQANVTELSVMQREFSTALPPGPSNSADFDPTRRAWATPGAPVAAGAVMKLTTKNTVRAIVPADNDVSGQTGFLLTGVANNSDVVAEPRFYIRRANPLYDPAQAITPNVRVDGPPDTAQNTPLVNWPTTRIWTPNTAFRADMVLFGDGAAEWQVDGVALQFDPSFFSLNPALEADLQAAKARAGLPNPTSPPYTRFLTDMATLDEMQFWSGNNLGGFGDALYVDDVKVTGPLRAPGAGVPYALPLADDFANYALDQPIAAQGDGLEPRVFGPLNTPTVRLSPIRASWLATGSFTPTTSWCVYTVAEVIPQVDRNGMTIPDQWGFAVGKTVYVRAPFAGYQCPQRASTPGAANLTLLDPATNSPRAPGLLRVGAPSTVVSDGAAADYRADDDRFLPTSYFCRYQLTTVNAEPDASMGGTPFPIPPGWTPGTVVAIDSLFAPGVNGLRMCPRIVSAQPGYRVENAMDCITTTGQWQIVSTGVPTCGGLSPIAAAVNNAPNTDLRGYAFVSIPDPRWDGLIDATFTASGRYGDGWVREAQSRLDLVKTALQGMDVSIDPSGAFGEVLELQNVDAAAPMPRTLYESAGVTLPAVVAQSIGVQQPERRAVMCFDLYVQDTNTRIAMQYMGAETDCDGGTALVAALRFGGPDTVDGVPQGNIARLTSATTNVWADTGVAVPIGQWFRVCIELQGGGVWAAGMNTTGNPGGPGDPPQIGLITSLGRRNYALPGAGIGTPNARFIAQGTSLATESTGGAPVHTLNRLVVAQGADDTGDGVGPPPEIPSRWWVDTLTLQRTILECGSPCPADLTGDGLIGSGDLAFLLGAWGPNPGNPADLSHDGVVNAADLAILLGSWGLCPC